MKKSLVFVFMCCAFALMMGLAACGGSSSGSAASTSASASTASSATASTSAASASAASASSTASAAAEAAAKAEYDRAVALFEKGKYYSAKAAFEKSQYQDWEQRAAACVQPMPETGELYHDPGMTSDSMSLTFTVNEESSGTGMYIAVYTEDKSLVESMFIKGSGSVETWIPAGLYYVKDAIGYEWYGIDEQFGPDGHYENMVFDEVDGNSYLTVLDDGYAWEIEINTTSVEGQGVSAEEVDWENRD